MELVFTRDRIKTDLMLYKEKSELLIPSPGEENRFHALCTSTITRFFISSTSLESLSRMRFFFYRLYDAIAEETDISFGEYSHRISLTNSTIMHRKVENYYPRFVKNVFELPEVIDDLPFLYTVVIRSSGHLLSKRLSFNFLTMISSTSDDNISKLRNYLTQEIIAMKAEMKWKLKMPRIPWMKDDIFRNPFNLVNFVRIPSEHDIIS